MLHAAREVQHYAKPEASYRPGTFGAVFLKRLDDEQANE
jgi:hypothetical protein